MRLSEYVKQPRLLWVFALFCAAMNGSCTPFIKLGYSSFGIAPGDVGSQLLMAGTRFIVGSLLLFAIVGIGEHRLLLPSGRKSIGPIVLLTFTQTVLLHGLFYLGSAHATGAFAAIINGSAGFISILMATFVFRSEKMTLRKAVSCLLCLGSLLMMNKSGLALGIHPSWKGEGLIFLALVANGVSNNLIKRFSQQEDPSVLCFWQMNLGGIVLLTVGLLSGGRLTNITPGGLLILLHLSLVSATATSLMNVLLKYHPISRANIFSLAIPLFGLLFSATLLHETEQVFRLDTLFSVLLLVSGIVLVNLNGLRQEKNV